MACLQIYRELLLLATFLQVHSNSKDVSYLYWQNGYPNWKTTCYIKLKLFLWTRLLESLLLAKYLISVFATLESDSHLPKKICFICFTESPLKGMKNAFYFILKTVFVLKIFNFFVLIFWSCTKKWLKKGLISKNMTSQLGIVRKGVPAPPPF